MLLLLLLLSLKLQRARTSKDRSWRHYPDRGAFPSHHGEHVSIYFSSSQPTKNLWKINMHISSIIGIYYVY